MAGLATRFRVVADPDLAQEIDQDGVEGNWFAVEEVRHPRVTGGVGVGSL